MQAVEGGNRETKGENKDRAGHARKKRAKGPGQGGGGSLGGRGGEVREHTLGG